jgi:hypothetical protein
MRNGSRRMGIGATAEALKDKRSHAHQKDQERSQGRTNGHRNPITSFTRSRKVEIAQRSGQRPSACLFNAEVALWVCSG